MRLSWRCKIGCARLRSGVNGRIGGGWIRFCLVGVCCCVLVAVGLKCCVDIGENRYAFGESEEVEYGSVSSVSNRSRATGTGGPGDDYVQTKLYPFNGSSTSSVRTDTIDINVGETVHITFSHELYATKESTGVSWKVIRSGFGGSGYSISYPASGSYSANSSSHSASGTANTNEKTYDGAYYKVRDGYSDGGDTFVHRDFYEITFTKNGEYEFCESFYIEGSFNTEACSEIRVNSVKQIESYSYEDEYERDGFTINGKSELKDVTNAVYSAGAGAYEATSLDSVATFTHTLQQTNYENFQTSVSFGVNGGLNRSGTLRSGTPYIYGYDDNHEAVNPDLSIADDYYELCQNISFKAKSWTITKKYSCEYKTIKTKTCTGSTCRTVVDGTQYLGRTLVETSLSNSGNNGESERVCAKVHRPWNFKVSSIKAQDTSPDDVAGLAYAGGEVSVKNFEIAVNKNDDRYLITDVPNATIKVVGYVVVAGAPNYEMQDGDYNISNIESYYRDAISGISGFYELATVTRRIYRSGMDASSGYHYYKDADAYNVVVNPVSSVKVPDVAAGARFCVAVAIGSANSGNGYVSGFGSGWTVSNSYCHIVAKKPSFQVWGGGISARGTIVTSVSNKSQFDIGGALVGVSGVISFGSWVEQESRTTGAVELLATGAATGNNNNSVGGSRVGGSYEEALSFCKYRVPLSFANYLNATNPERCSSGNMGATSVGYSGINLSSVDRDAPINYFVNGTNTSELRDFSDAIDLNSPANYDQIEEMENGGKVRYTHGGGDLAVSGASLSNGVTHIVKTDGNITILGNLIYTPSSSHVSSASIPKLVIRANNIVIDCDVTRIDAVLIADNVINTCASVVDGTIVSPDLNSRERSRQLEINGAVIAGKLDLMRTYGAAAGVNSGIPAEIINYDTSIVLWAQSVTSNVGRDSLTSVYQKELAPRY